MANTTLTHQMIAREAAAMLEEELPFLHGLNRTREKDIARDVNGYSEGASVKIKIPPASKVYSGAVFAEGGAAPNQKENYATLTVDTRKHTALSFTAAEKALELTDFKERFLKPNISTLASVVHADLLQKSLAWIPSIVGTAGTTPATTKVWADCRSELERNLAPTSPRMAIWSSDAQSALGDSAKVLFHPSQLLEKYMIEGSMGRFQGAEFFESQSVPTLTNGTQTLSGITVSGAGQSGSSLLIAGLTAGLTIKAGQVFSIASVYAVHPLTGIVYVGKARQFVVTQDFVASATTGTISIYPPIATGAPDLPTASALPADGAALTWFGAANTSYRQNIMFQRDAFAAAFVPLPILAGCEGYTFTTDTMSVRVMTFGNGYLDAEGTRVDVLYGFTGVRGVHATRATE